ncbi:MAG TPA: hypothetical protein VLA23_02155 [Candidatus Limnocylindrales bacterium]|nr:hypothetical protein [Candidatus Limnocylindrales bacterium]
MTELLTESFCERCGTRYTFQTAVPKAGRVRSLKVLSKGLRNFVASDDISLSDAFADARTDQEREASTHQLEAFHKTFSFCLNCRQYTCGNCWNDVENRCLTCAPDLSREILPAAFPAPVGQEVEPPPERPVPVRDASAWPTADLVQATAEPAVAEPSTARPELDEAMTEVLPGAAAVVAGAPGPSEAADTVVADVEEAAPPVVEPSPVAPPPIETEAAEPGAEGGVAPTTATPEQPAAATEVEAPAPDQPTVRDGGIDDRAAAAAAGTAALLRKFRPGESLDAALAEYEAGEGTEAGAAAAPVDQPPARPAVTPAPTPEPEADIPPAAAAEPPAPQPAPPQRDIVGEPTWRITAPDTAAPSTTPAVPPPSVPERPAASAPGTMPAWPPLPPDAEPSWPVTPQWPPLPAQASSSQDAMWAASSRDVVGAQGPSATRPCVSCGLSLSATARFCRRCGSPQG